MAGALAGAGLTGVVPARALQTLFGLALAYSAFTTIRQLRIEVPESFRVVAKSDSYATIVTPVGNLRWTARSASA